MTNIDDTFNAPAPAVAAKATREDILASLQWTDPAEVQTIKGPRMVRKAKAPREFFDLWHNESNALRAAGYSLGEWPKGSGKWMVSEWREVPQQVIVRREESKAMSRATDAQINAPVPEGLAYMPFQRGGIAFGFDRPSVLIGDEMGLGKTIQAIGIVNCLPEAKRIVVICPASLKLNWQREITKWQVIKRPVFVADSQMFPDMFGWVVVNYDVLHKHEDILHSLEFDVLITDEAHYLKNPKARRSKMVLGIKPTEKQRAAGIPEVPGIRATKKIFLTGTPIANKPMELFPIINYLDPITWPNFFKYGLRYCAGTNSGGHWDFTGSSNLLELQDKLRSTIMVRRLKKDVLTELPAKRRQVIELSTDGDTKRLLKAERDFYEGRQDALDDLQAKVELAKADDNEDTYRLAVAELHKGQATVFSAMAALRRDTAVAKIPQVIAHLHELLDDGDEAFVVMCHHHEVSDALMQEFQDCAVLHRGDLSLMQKDAAVIQFQGDKTQKHDPAIRLFVGSIQASGVGITLTRASHVVFAELDWVPGNVSQAEDRCHRIGQSESVLIQHLVLEESLDAVMAKRIIAKQEVIDKALDAKDSPPVMGKEHGASEGTPREKLAREAEAMNPGQIDAAHEAIRFIALRCNGAKDYDGQGFSKIDTTIGKSLAAAQFLTPRQAALARKIALKYRGQLGEDMTARLL